MASLQKAIKVGSSVAVVIPKKSLKALGIKAGMQLALDVDEKNQRVVVSHPAPLADTEILDWSNRFIKRYRKALEALAK
ncbi:AbrB family transcriptional regulator [Patescibacteria group bacterium]|nr:AbrB family transcriptional regulator [Patescibacteria group bacterium]